LALNFKKNTPRLITLFDIDIKLVLLIFILTLTQLCFAETNRFYTKNDGLTGTYFHCMLQDSKGYLWIGTKSGLNRFNGYNFEVYYYDSNDSSSLNSSTAISVFEDKNGRLWIGTNHGLNLYNPEKDCFERIQLSYNNLPITVSIKGFIQQSPDYFYMITSNGLIRFYTETRKQEFFNLKFEPNGTPSFTEFNNGVMDSKGNIWIVTSFNGLVIFDTSENKFSSIKEYTNSNFEIPDNILITIDITTKAEIIIGAQQGDIIVYDSNKKQFSRIPFATETDKQLSGGIASIITDKDGTTWVGTEYHGLKILDLNSNKLTDANSLIDVDNISHSKVLCYRDRSNDIWFAVLYQGLYHKTKPLNPFYSYSYTNQNLSHHLVKSILLDSKMNLWVGTDGGDLNVMPQQSSKFESSNQFLKGSTSLNGKVVMCMFEDERGWIWIGTYLEGLFCYRGKQLGLKHYPMAMEGTKKTLNSIFSIKEANNGNLWIGTNGSGLIYLDVKQEKAVPFDEIEIINKNEILLIHINDIIYDSDSTLWLATYNGFYSWNKNKKIFRNYIESFPELNNKSIYNLEEGPGNTLLIASNSGLFIFDKNTDSLTNYTITDGLANNTVMAIQVDDKNNYWLSTANGISKFNYQTKTFLNYFSFDGLPCDEFMPNSSYKDASGFLYFGGVNGLVKFHPVLIVERKEKPNLIFTKFSILDQELKKGLLPDNRKILQKVINETDTIRLEYSDKRFSFEFAAIDFYTPEKIKYAVMMTGFDKNWLVKDSKHRYATYTNLNPGSYIFKVKSTNAEGVWIEPAREIVIIITPPIWMTWWAFLVYILIVALAVYYIRSVSLFRIRMKNNLHLEKLERQKIESINKDKLQFFTNISHEIRTPLSMMLAPLHQLSLSRLDSSQIKFISYIQRNTKRLERLVNQLLELQKIENAQLEITQKEFDVVGFIREILTLFEGLAVQQKIELLFEPGINKLIVVSDPDKLDKILFNLVSNAIKFTPPDGFITVTVDIQKTNKHDDFNLFEITVSDSGRGIKQEYTQKIFERFYQVEAGESTFQTGSGIGLHIVKNLVEIQNGEITVESKPGIGTTFKIRLPLNLNYHFENVQNEKENYSSKHPTIDPDIFEIPADKETQDDYLLQNSSKPIVLIVEDELDILHFLEKQLSEKYKILKAKDGDTGWKLASEKNPDLILSDVMMPGLNGIQFCHKVKTTFETSHIPFILLTAKVGFENEMKGLETGADDYISKPFHTPLLLLKVENMIESREILKQKFSKGMSFVAKEMTVTSSDEKFLQQAMDYVKNNLSNSEFSIEEMCIKLGISRVHLYRKLKALTNHSPTEFIRIIRLKQAAYLLCQNKLNISEIAYQVGFNSHQYFTNSFQKYFKMSPTEYVASQPDSSE